MTKLIEKLQRSFKSLASDQQQKATRLETSGAANLSDHNAAFDQRFAEFRTGLAQAFPQLSDGRCLFAPDYQALTAFAEQNNLSLSHVLEACKIESNRVTELKLSESGITDLSSLSGLNKLRALELDENKISDVTPLAGLSELEFLSLCENKLSDISVLRNLKCLARLWLNNMQISDISPLAGLGNLRELFLSSNRLSDITPLVGLKQIKTLRLWNNPLSAESLRYANNIGARRGVSVMT